MLLALLVVAIGGAMLTAPVAALANEGTVVAGHGTVGPSSTVTVAASLLRRRCARMAPDRQRAGLPLRVPGDGVRVLADTVLVGGVIVHATNPTLIGNTSLIAVDDGGPGEPDNVGIAFTTPASTAVRCSRCR